MSNDDRITHLTFIQAIIDRMNRNSFQLKGWAIVILSALLALYANSENPVYLYICFIPTLAFWVLDSYYLQQERKFRGIYADVVADNGNVKPFEMPVNKYSGGRFGFFRVFFSKSLSIFYALVLFLISLALIIG